MINSFANAHSITSASQLKVILISRCGAAAYTKLIIFRMVYIGIIKTQ